MECLRGGSLNMNGGRDRTKRAVAYEAIRQKSVSVGCFAENS